MVAAVEKTDPRTVPGAVVKVPSGDRCYVTGVKNGRVQVDYEARQLGSDSYPVHLLTLVQEAPEEKDNGQVDQATRKVSRKANRSRNQQNNELELNRNDASDADGSDSRVDRGEGRSLLFECGQRVELTWNGDPPKSLSMVALGSQGQIDKKKIDRPGQRNQVVQYRVHLDDGGRIWVFEKYLKPVSQEEVDNPPDVKTTLKARDRVTWCKFPKAIYEVSRIGSARAIITLLEETNPGSKLAPAETSVAVTELEKCQEAQTQLAKCEPQQPTAQKLVEDAKTLWGEIDQAIEVAEQAQYSALDSARLLGETLLKLKAQIKHGEWETTRAKITHPKTGQSLPSSTATLYQRISEHWQEITSAGINSVKAADQHLRQLKASQKDPSQATWERIKAAAEQEGKPIFQTGDRVEFGTNFGLVLKVEGERLQVQWNNDPKNRSSYTHSEAWQYAFKKFEVKLEPPAPGRDWQPGDRVIGKADTGKQVEGVVAAVGAGYLRLTDNTAIYNPQLVGFSAPAQDEQPEPVSEDAQLAGEQSQLENNQPEAALDSELTPAQKEILKNLKAIAQIASDEVYKQLCKRMAEFDLQVVVETSEEINEAIASILEMNFLGA